MARTRGSSHAFHQDDGELLDKEGKPIPTEALRSPEAALAALAATPEPTPEEPPAEPLPALWRCDRTSWSRDMDGFEALHILELLMGEIVIEADADRFNTLNPNVRRHFRKVQ